MPFGDTEQYCKVYPENESNIATAKKEIAMAEMKIKSMKQYLKSAEPIAKRQRNNCKAKFYVSGKVTNQLLTLPSVSGGKSRRRKSSRKSRRRKTRRRKTRRH